MLESDGASLLFHIGQSEWISLMKRSINNTIKEVKVCEPLCTCVKNISGRLNSKYKILEVETVGIFKE